jgi:hypothetical protein
MAQSEQRAQAWDGDAPAGPAVREGAAARAFSVAAWLALAASLWAVYAGLGSAPGRADFLFDSDGLFLPALYEDLFVDGYPWSGWRFPPAPYYFPDMAAFFALRAAIPSLPWAVLAYAALQLLLLVAGLHAVSSAWLGGRHRAAQGLLTLAVALLAQLYAAGHFRPLEFFVVSAHHGGAACLAFAGLALLLHLLSRPWRPWSLGALALLGALAAASDKVFLAMFTGPALAALGVLAVLGRLPWRRALALGALVLAPQAAVLLAERLLTVSVTADTYFVPDPERSRAAAQALQETLGRWARGPELLPLLAWGVGLLLALRTLLSAGVHALLGVRALRALLGPRAPAAGGGPGTAAVAYAAFSVASLAPVPVVVATGNFVHDRDFRYLLVALLAPLLLPVFTAGARLAVAGPVRWARGPVAALGVGLAVAPGLARPLVPAAPVEDYYPEALRCLDAVAAKDGLALGVGGYWHAKSTTYLSRSGVRVLQFDGFALYHWINNREWYVQAPRGAATLPAFDFALVDGALPADALLKHAGPPDHTHRCGPAEVWVYGEASRLDPAVRDVAGRQDRVLDFKYGQAPSLVLPGRQLFSEHGVAEGDSLLARAGAHPPGFFTFGPYVGLPAGHYVLALDYVQDADAAAEPSTWDAGFSLPSGPDVRARGLLSRAPGAVRLEVPFEVPLERADAPMELRLVYPGRGTLRVDRFEVRPVAPPAP